MVTSSFYDNGENNKRNRITQISDLEFGDPLYLHPSDTNTTFLVNSKLKETENYNVWSCAMILAL